MAAAAPADPQELIKAKAAEATSALSSKIAYATVWAQVGAAPVMHAGHASVQTRRLPDSKRSSWRAACAKQLGLLLR